MTFLITTQDPGYELKPIINQCLKVWNKRGIEQNHYLACF